VPQRARLARLESSRRRNSASSCSRRLNSASASRSAPSKEDLKYWYEEILVERAVLSRSDFPGTVLRLPKVYGPQENADLATVYGCRQQPLWRWTHGHVKNVAKAIALAASDPRAASNIFNVGEAHTPTMSERLNHLPDRHVALASEEGKNFTQDIADDTSKVRREPGFIEDINEIDAIAECVGGEDLRPT
jgi:nucleoside-diphosphate-sugar epimerase